MCSLKSFPRGCFLDLAHPHWQRIFFNNHTVGAGNVRARLLCAGAPTSLQGRRMCVRRVCVGVWVCVCVLCCVVVCFFGWVGALTFMHTLA